MFAVRDIVMITIDFVTLVASFPGNLFIIVVNIMDWSNNLRLSISDQLIFGIGVFNILNGFLKCSVLIALVLNITCISVCVNGTFFCFKMLMSCNLWFSTWLCVHFCLKIVNINQPFYIYLQRSYHKMFPWLLLPSVLGSILVSFPSINRTLPINTLNVSNQTNSPPFPLDSIYFFSSQIYIAVSSAAFLLFTASALTIIFSLYKHMKRMQQNSCVQIRICAVKTVTFLLACNLLNITVLQLSISKIEDSKWHHYISIVASICLTINSLILIRGNNKLAKRLTELLIICPCTRISSNPAIA